MKKNLRFAIAILIVSSMMSTTFLVISQGSVLAASTYLSSKAPASELSWAEGDSFPVVNGHTVYPTIPPSVPAPNLEAHWYAGSYFSASQGNQNASSITTSIDVPNTTPLADEFYYVLLSAFDSNESYDQIGFSNDYGTWGLTYSWTYFDSNGFRRYNYSPNVAALSPGVTYKFDIITQNNTTSFAAYQGSTPIWSYDAPTGGNYLFVAPYDYTAYEEMCYVHTSGGAPGFNFYFHDQSWVATNGSSYRPVWTSFTANNPDPVPSGLNVLIDGGDVYIWNPNVIPSKYPVSVDVSSVNPLPPHYSPFQVYHNGMRYNGASLSMSYAITVTRFDSETHITTLWLEIDLIRTNVNNASDWRTLDTTQVAAHCGGQATWTADWNETNTITAGYWYISATVKVLSFDAFDMNTDDDQLTNDTVQAKVLTGDINGSGEVDIYDAVLLATAFGTKPGDQYWNLDADINGDGIVDIFDGIMLGGHFSWNINGPRGRTSLPGGGRLATAGTTSILLSPSQITVFKDEIFSVNVIVDDVANLYGWEFKLFWNSNVLNCTGFVVQIPTEWQDNNQIVGGGLQANYNATHSRYWQGEYTLYPAPSFNGTMTMVTLTFRAMQAGTASLTLTDVKLGDSEAQPINYTATDGSVTVYYDWHMRSDAATINGLNAYLLNATETTSYTYAQRIGQGLGADFGIRAWVRASNGTEYEVTLDGQTGIPRATVSETGWGTVYVTQKAMETTFSLVIRVYVSIEGGAWTNMATFTTTQLGKTCLQETTWSVYYYVSQSYNPRLDRTTARFYWGDANHMSRMQNIQFS